MENVKLKDLDEVLTLTYLNNYLSDFYNSKQTLYGLFYKGSNYNDYNNHELKITKSKQQFNSAYKNLIEINLFWEHCSFTVFKDTYEERKQTFFQDFIDADEIDFLNEELLNLSVFPNDYLSYLNESGYPTETDTLFIDETLNIVTVKNIRFSEHKKHIFINSKIKSIINKENQPIEVNSNDISQKATFKTNFKQIELVELIKALIENGNIDGNKMDIFEQFGKFFNTEINRPFNKMEDLKDRNNDSETIFLDKLKVSLYEFIRK